MVVRCLLGLRALRAVHSLYIVNLLLDNLTVVRPMPRAVQLAVWQGASGLIVLFVFCLRRGLGAIRFTALMIILSIFLSCLLGFFCRMAGQAFQRFLAFSELNHFGNRFCSTIEVMCYHVLLPRLGRSKLCKFEHFEIG